MEEHLADTAVVETSQQEEPIVLLFVFVSLAVGIVIRFLVTHFSIPLPYTVCVLVVSALLSLAETNTTNMFVGSMVSFELMKPDVIVFVFLPVLLFEGAFALDSQYLGRTWQAAVLLATFGVVLVTVLMAVVGVYCLNYDWSWYTAFMFGALMAATDPVAVVAIMSELGGSKALSTVIDGESLLNDGTAYILYLLFLQFATGTIQGAGETVLQFLQISVGGPLFGLGCGIVIAFFLARVFNHPDVEITTTVVGAYLTFYFAQGPLGTSGVLAVVIFGMYLGKHRNTISPDVRHSLHATWSFLSYIANTLIFSLAGAIVGRTLFVTSLGTIDGHDVGNLVLVYLMCNLQRACAVAILWPLIRRSVHTEVTLNRREFLQLSWSGLRGGMTLVLALLTYGNPLLDHLVRSKILFLAAGVVLLTLVINATTSRPLLQGLGLHKGDKESQLVLSYAFLHMARRTENAVETLKSQAHMQSVNWMSLLASIPNFREDRKPKASMLASPILARADAPDGPVKSEQKTITNERDPKEQETLIEIVTTPKFQEKCQLEESGSRHLVMHRLLAFLRADFVAQYSAGLITARSLNVLVGAVRVAQDDDDLSQQWKHIRSHFVLSPLLLRLYSSDSVLRSSILSSHIAKWLFSHLTLSSELALALASSKQRLDERVGFFQSDLHVDAKIIDAVQTEFNDECAAAEEAANDVMTAFPQVREAVETRHAMQFILRLQRSEVEDLLLSGLLENAEAARISSQVESQIYNLQLRPWKGQVELPDKVFLGLPFVKATSKENQQRMLRQSNRRVFQHGQLIHIPSDSIGVVVRGVVLSEYFCAKQDSPLVDSWLGDRLPDELKPQAQNRPVYHLAHGSAEAIDLPMWHEKVSKGGIITQKSMALTPHHEDDTDQFMVKKNIALTFCEIYTLRLALLLELGSLNAQFRYLLLKVVAGQLLRSRFQDCHKENDLDSVINRAKVEWCALGAFENGNEVTPTNKVHLLPGDRWLLIEGSGTAHYEDGGEDGGGGGGRGVHSSLHVPTFARNRFRPTCSCPNILLSDRPSPSSFSSSVAHAREVNPTAENNNNNNNNISPELKSQNSASSQTSSPALQANNNNEPALLPPLSHLPPPSSPSSSYINNHEHVLLPHSHPLSSSSSSCTTASSSSFFPPPSSSSSSSSAPSPPRPPAEILSDLTTSLLTDVKHASELTSSRNLRRASLGSNKYEESKKTTTNSTSMIQLGMLPSSSLNHKKESPPQKPMNTRSKSAKTNTRGHVGTTLPSFLPAPFFIRFECPHSHHHSRERECGCHITIEVARGAYLCWSAEDTVPPLEQVCVLTGSHPEVNGEALPDLMGVFQALTRQVSAPDFNKLDESARPAD